MNSAETVKAVMKSPIELAAEWGVTLPAAYVHDRNHEARLSADYIDDVLMVNHIRLQPTGDQVAAVAAVMSVGVRFAAQLYDNATLHKIADAYDDYARLGKDMTLAVLRHPWSAGQ